MITYISGFATTNEVFSKQINELSGDGVIIAWSMGVFEAVRLYFEKPQEIKKLVLISGTPKFLKDETFEQGLSLALFRNIERKIKANIEEGLEFFYELIPLEEGRGRVISHKSRTTKEILADLERIKNEDIRPLLPKIEIPVLLIHGDKDQICLPEASKYMAEVIPGSRLIIFENCGHAPFIEQPERFNSIVKDFLEC